MQDLALHEYQSDSEQHSVCCSTAGSPELQMPPEISISSHSSLYPGGFISGATVAG